MGVFCWTLIKRQCAALCRRGRKRAENKEEKRRCVASRRRTEAIKLK